MLTFDQIIKLSKPGQAEYARKQKETYLQAFPGRTWPPAINDNCNEPGFRNQGRKHPGNECRVICEYGCCKYCPQSSSCEEMCFF